MGRRLDQLLKHPDEHIRFRIGCKLFHLGEQLGCAPQLGKHVIAHRHAISPHGGIGFERIARRKPRERRQQHIGQGGAVPRVAVEKLEHGEERTAEIGLRKRPARLQANAQPRIGEPVLHMREHGDRVLARHDDIARLCKTDDFIGDKPRLGKAARREREPHLDALGRLRHAFSAYGWLDFKLELRTCGEKALLHPAERARFEHEHVHWPPEHGFALSRQQCGGIPQLDKSQASQLVAIRNQAAQEGLLGCGKASDGLSFPYAVKRVFELRHPGRHAHARCCERRKPWRIVRMGTLREDNVHDDLALHVADQHAPVAMQLPQVGYPGIERGDRLGKQAARALVCTTLAPALNLRERRKYDDVVASHLRHHRYMPWHFLNFLPLPQGQGSLRPTLA